MNNAERENLIKLAKNRAAQAKREAEARQVALLADVQDHITAEYESRDQLWDEAVKIAEDQVRKTNDHIAAECSLLGIPAKDAPKVELVWVSRRVHFADPGRRAELRKLAATRLEALTKRAKTEIDAKALDIETELRAGSLESDDAKAFLAAMPKADDLMPPLTLDGLGIHSWQPPKDAAGQLLTPTTATGRKRMIIARAIDSDPDASNRAIAARTGADHKTVASVRESMSGEIPGIGSGSGGSPGEIPGTVPLPLDADDDGGA